MKPYFAALLCGILCFAAGCSDIGPGAPAAASEVVNSHCPIMGDEIDGQTFVEWNGQKVGFCCPPCIDDWKAMDDAERTQKLANADTETHEHAEHGEHEHAEHGDAAAAEYQDPADAQSKANSAE